MKEITKEALQECVKHFDEDDLVISLECEHHELRQLIKQYNLDYNFKFLTQSCKNEINFYSTEWNTSKLARYFNVSLIDIQRVLYNKESRQEQIKQLALQGVSVAQLAHDFNLAEVTINNILNRKDYKMSAKKQKTLKQLIKENKPTNYIAETLNISAARVSQVKNLLGYTDKSDLKELAIKLAAKGKSQEAIAIELGVSQSTISRWLSC